MLASSPDILDSERDDPPSHEARIDLHCRSRYSTSANLWPAAVLGLTASHTEPSTVYRLAKMRGMTHVTLAVFCLMGALFTAQGLVALPP